MKPVTGYEAIKTGELFLLSTALVGPMIYIIHKKYGEMESSPDRPNSFINYSVNFPYGLGFITLCFGICLVSSVVFYLLRNPVFDASEIAKLIDYNGVINLSWVTFLLATAIFFCATAYRNSLDNVSRVMPNQEAAFVREWQKKK